MPNYIRKEWKVVEIKRNASVFTVEKIVSAT